MSDDKGWIKIHRVLLDKPIWQLSTPEQKSILITLLLMANHREKKWEWNGTQFACQPGQFVTSLEKIAEKSGAGISVKNVRTAIARFEKLGFLANESAKTGRLITIVNWGNYQLLDKEGGKETGKDLAKTRQTPGKHLATNKNDKNVENEKNVKKNTYTCEFEALWDAYPRKKEKAMAYKQYLARLNNGFSEDELMTAVKRYAEECRKNKTEQRYIKQGATFLGPNTPFEDYLRGGEAIGKPGRNTEPDETDIVRRAIEQGAGSERFEW